MVGHNTPPPSPPFYPELPNVYNRLPQPSYPQQPYVFNNLIFLTNNQSTKEGVYNANLKAQAHLDKTDDGEDEGSDEECQDHQGTGGAVQGPLQDADQLHTEVINPRSPITESSGQPITDHRTSNFLADYGTSWTWRKTTQ